MIGRLLKKTLIALLTVSFIVTGGCGNKEKDTSASQASEATVAEEESTPPGSEKEVLQEPEDDVNSAQDFDLSEYFTVEEVMQKYADYLKMVIPEDETNDMMHYTLAYINSDAIPELIYMEGSFHAAGVHVCICDADGKVSDIGEFGEYGNMAYIPRTGKILSFYMNQGVYFVDFYVLKGLSLTDDTYFEIDEAVLDTETDHYYVDGDEVSEDEYYEKYYKMNSNTYTYINYDKALSYKDSDDVFRILNEYALTGVKPSVIDIKNTAFDFVGEWSVKSMSTNKGSGYLAAELMDLSGSLTLNDEGRVTVEIKYGDEGFEDVLMPIASKGTSGIAPYFTSLGFANEDLSRSYEAYLTSEGTMELQISDFAGLFDGNYTCYLTFERKKNVD